jgi:hypothetical protein
MKESNKGAEQARKSGKRHMTPAFEKFVQSFEGVQKEAEGFNFSTLGKGKAALKRSTFRTPSWRGSSS